MYTATHHLAGAKHEQVLVRPGGPRRRAGSRHAEATRLDFTQFVKESRWLKGGGRDNKRDRDLSLGTCDARHEYKGIWGRNVVLGLHFMDRGMSPMTKETAESEHDLQ